jgi:cytidylate kinase
MNEPVPRPLIVAVDGPAASGKTTLARRLAAHFGLAFLDTGLLYRAVGRRLLDRGLRPGDAAAAERAAQEVTAEDLARPDLHRPETSRAASEVAVVPSVRATLLALQRRFGEDGPGAVLAGRDIGTVVRPDAARKLFVTASPEERARRRFEELRLSGAAPIYERVLEELRQRDERDRSRAVAPLVAADDAFVLDTTGRDVDDAFRLACGYVDSGASGA